MASTTTAAAARHLTARLPQSTARLQSCARHAQQRRAFTTTPRSRAAKNFTMPAMSPTMTEGNITAWKLKEGDSFSAGDIILEIETDKAQMDVEAQEDGQIFKIMEQDGAKGVRVGSRIGVLAESTDDLSSLEIPADEEAAAAPAKKEAPEPSKAPPKETAPEKSEDKPPAAGSQPAQKYPLYPSVEALLHTHNLSASDVKATGPSGRLLKGDVLAHLKLIKPSYPAEQATRINNLAHLDLSNIKLAPRKAPPPPAAASPDAPTPPTRVALTISLGALADTQQRIESALGVHLPLSTFVARASALANEDLPRAATPPTQAELFDALVGVAPSARRTSHGDYVPTITSLPPVPLGPRLPVRRQPRDIIDELTGARAPVARVSEARREPGTRAAVSNVFSVVVPKGEERRARVYLERMKTVLQEEPGRLVL